MIPKSLIISHILALSTLTVVFKAAMSFKDITDAMAFYGVYHREPLNQLIHFFGVPAIIWSGLVFLAHLKVPILSSSINISFLPHTPSHPINYATVLSVFYSLFYLSIDRFGGTLYTPIVYLMYVTAVNTTLNSIHSKPTYNPNTTSSWIGSGKALKYALLIHFLGWYIQIHPGHYIIEGAQPAIMQSLGGALTSAPLFAFYELIWFLGFNLQLRDETKSLVDLYTAKLCNDSSNVVMRACGKL